MIEKQRNRFRETVKQRNKETKKQKQINRRPACCTEYDYCSRFWSFEEVSLLRHRRDKMVEERKETDAGVEYDRIIIKPLLIKYDYMYVN